MNIVTLTLNPAFDKHCYVDSFKPYHENIAAITSIDAGGKGVNISRALTANGIDNRAVILVGEDNRDEFEASLKEDGINCTFVSVSGRIRENLTLHSGDGKSETRISFDGFKCGVELLRDAFASVDGCDSDTVLTFTGSIPSGITVEEVKDELLNLKEKGVKIVVDSRSFSISDLLDFKPWLIKPNEDEASAYIEREIKDPVEALAVAKTWRAKGVENVLISLGGEGAALSCEDGDYIVTTPKIDVASTIGAGDSMIAGFVGAYSEGFGLVDSLKRAVAYGSAACLREGTRPPLKEDVERILNEIGIIKV